MAKKKSKFGSPEARRIAKERVAKYGIHAPFPPDPAVVKAEALIAKTRGALKYRRGVLEARRLSQQVAEVLVVPTGDPDWERLAESSQEAVRKDEQRLWAEIEAASPPEIYSGMPGALPGGPKDFAEHRGYGIWGGQDADGRWFAWLPGLEEKYGFIGYRPSKADAVRKAKKLIDYIEGEYAKPDRNPKKGRRKKSRGKNPSRADVLRRAMRGT